MPFFSTQWKKFFGIFHTMEEMFPRCGKRLALVLLAAGLAGAGCRSPRTPSLGIPRARHWRMTASAWEAGGEPRRAVDGRTNTWWRSGPQEPQWIQADLSRPATVCGFSLQWMEPAALAYRVETSLDGVQWAIGYETTSGDGDWDQGSLGPIEARYVRVVVTKGRQGTGAALSQLEIKGLETQSAFLLEGAGGTYAPAPGTEAMLDGKSETAWHAPGPTARVLLDLRRVRPVGGVRVDWGPDGFASNTVVEVSENGTNWVSFGYLQAQEGDFSVLMAATVQPARYLRLAFSGASAPEGFAVAEFKVRGAKGVADIWSRYELAAEKAPDGVYPDALRKRQNFWALACGLEEGAAECLLDEWGVFAPREASPTLTPLLLTADGVMTARQAEAVEHRLGGSGAPLPETVWQLGGGLRLRIRAMARPGAAPPMGWVEYELANDSLMTHTGRLCWVVRPTRLPPPWAGGGLAPIARIRAGMAPGGWQEIRVNGDPLFAVPEPGLAFGAAAFDEGDVVEVLLRGETPPPRMAWDGDGLASAAWWLDYTLEPGGKIRRVIAANAQAPLVRSWRRFPWPDVAGAEEAAAMFDREWLDAAWTWREATTRLNPRVARPGAMESLRMQTGWLLGVRTVMGAAEGETMESICLRVAALLRAGRADAARPWIERAGAGIQTNGWVPAIWRPDGRVDAPDGRAGWHASQGQYAFMVLDYFRFTQDTAFLHETYPRLKAALQYLAELRAELAAEEWRLSDRDRDLVEGLLPPRVVREHSPAVHPYADQFWALLGWKEMKAAAARLGHTEDATWAESHYRTLRAAVRRSLRERMDRMEGFWLPGAAEDERPDPAATALLFWPCGETDLAEPHELQTTLDAFYEELLARQQPGWSGRIPASAGSLLGPLASMGRGDYAREVLYDLLNRQVPAGWHVWADAVGRDPRQPGVADTMPDIRAAATYLIGVRGLAARETGARLDLFSGAPPEWLQHGNGFQVADLPTEFGLLDLSGHVHRKHLAVEIGGPARPPGGYRIWWPRQMMPERVLAKGEPIQTFDSQGVNLPHDFYGRVDVFFPSPAPWPRDP